MEFNIREQISILFSLIGKSTVVQSINSLSVIVSEEDELFCVTLLSLDDSGGIVLFGLKRVSDGWFSFSGLLTSWGGGIELEELSKGVDWVKELEVLNKEVDWVK